MKTRAEARTGWRRRELLVVAAPALVHAALGPSAAAAERAKPHDGKKSAPSPAQPKQRTLPQPVLDMRDSIMDAVHSGRIEDLRTAIELNEIKPDFGTPIGVDPIAHLKTLSADATGYDLLAAISLLFDMAPASTPAGADIENNVVYVWPTFAVKGLDGLSPADEVQLHRLVRPDEIKAMRAAKSWTWWRLAIGADGTWHSFIR